MSRKSKKQAGPGKAAAMPSGKVRLNERRTVLGVCIFLAAIVWVVFGQTLHHEFINFDDDDYVFENPEVAQGLTFKGVVWAFTHFHSANWHPLTWISHMMDCQFYGLKPGGHHFTNVLLHTAAVILLFLVLRQMTGFLWRSAFVAAVFAVHPLRVESVAWVSERKDVLSGVFFMLTIGAYVRYVQRRSRVEGRESKAQGVSALDARRSTLDYCLVVFLFALGLMCKPTVVTLPFVLLLLDYWPLNRFEPSTFKLQLATISRLVFEKLPLFGLAAASCAVTIFAQSEAIRSFDQISLPLRVGNAFVSYVTYLGQMFWPSGLAVLYPFPANGGAHWKMILSPVFLLFISACAFVLRKTRPYLLAGWLWYLVMLVPVIGIFQVGSQARADRYTYLPQIGLYFLLAWAAADLCARWRHRRAVLGGCATIILAALIFCAHTQASYWRDSEALWTHTLACTSDNDTAHYNLGNVLFKKGRIGEALAHYQQALQINPGDAEAQNNLGDALLQMDNVDEAIVYYQQALQIKPDYAKAHYNLGNALLRNGRVDEAITHYQQALQIKPDDADIHFNLGNALIQNGKVGDAITHYQRALQIKPGFADAHYNLGIALVQNGKVGEAIPHYQQALQIKPGDVDILNNLAWLLATAPQASLRNGQQAMELAQQANQIVGGQNPVILHTLAAACAEAGRFDDARQNAQKAMDLARAAGQTNLLEQISGELKLYTAGLPFHQEGN